MKQEQTGKGTVYRTLLPDGNQTKAGVTFFHNAGISHMILQQTHLRTARWW